MVVDFVAVQHRFDNFTSSLRSKPYQRQKQSLEVQLSRFLASFSPPKVISGCSADDIIKFLISRDEYGKTVVHIDSCHKGNCMCPRRLAAGTVDARLGKIRSIFNNLGRTGEANPAAHPKIKDYLKFVRHEQAIKAVVPSQAVPLFFTKLKRLVLFLRNLIVQGSGLSPAGKYVLGRDVTFFVINFFTGDRASDLGQLRADQVFKFKDREGYLLNFTFGKTRTKGRPRPFALILIPQKEVCPVLWIRYYLTACEALGVTLAPGFFFGL